jgi:FHS family glucose/mannose:H+ symporter-like MFS transporter
MTEREATAPAVTVAGFGIFLLVGAAQASYGPSVPHIAARFGIHVAAAGLIVTAHFAGECVGVAVLGLAESRWGLRVCLLFSGSLFSVGLLAAATAPTWPLLLVAVGILGCGAGGLVILVNLYFATAFGTRSPAMLGLVNSVYGAGSFLGPALIAVAGTYPPVFAVVGVIGLVSTTGFLQTPRAAPTTLVPSYVVSGRKLGFVIAFAALLFVYEGLEAGIGAWEATDLISLGSSAQFAAAATSLFWIAFTLGRAISAPLAVRMTPPRLLLWALAVATVLLVGIRLHVNAPVSFALVGLCAAPIFPVVLPWLSKVVPNATTAMTYAILGAIIGSAVIPAVLGGLISVAGIQSLPLGIAACALVSFCFVAILVLRLRD